MKPGRSHWLILFYRLLLSAYPPAYRARFGNEMYATFLEGVEDARGQGQLGIYLLRELRDAPRSLLNAYWQGWWMRLGTGIGILQEAVSTADLPPAPPDGRDSWRQAFLELGLFILAGLFLLLSTYWEGIDTGWRHERDVLGKVIASLTLPFLLLAMARGLPRWSYPFGGLFFGFQVFFSYQSGTWLFLFAMSLPFLVLAVVAVITDPPRSRLPLPFRRIVQSLNMDWTRLSFCLYGAMPMVILRAFDDAHVDNRTPYLAFAVLAMVVCALFYCRSREVNLQVMLLLAGLTFSIYGAWLDKVYFVGGLMNWVTVPPVGIAELIWLLRLWLQWGFLLLLPVSFLLLKHASRMRRAI